MIADLIPIEKEFTNASGFDLSYVDLMTDLKTTALGKTYPTYTEIKYDEDGVPLNELTPEEEKTNASIESVMSFNIGVYYSVQVKNELTHRLDITTIDKHNYDHVIINGYYADRPKEIQYSEDGELVLDPTKISNNKILTSVGSILFTNTTGINISLDNRFKMTNEYGQYVLNDEGKPIYSSIQSGDYFYLYFIIETLDGQQAELYYKFVYKPVVFEEEEDENKDNSDSENELNITSPDINIDDPDSSSMDISGIVLSDTRWEDYVFFNTVTVAQTNRLPGSTLTVHGGVLRMYVSPLCPVEFTITFNATVGSKTSTYTFNYVPKTLNVTGPTLDRCVKMNNPDVSYELLRTNPKLTGNIKVVIDSQDNIYLDTFKVSDSLSNRKYRHIKVGYNTYYGDSVMKYFRDMNSSDLYRIEPKCYNLFTTVQSFNDQYYDTYRMGVKTNNDKLYSENYAMLAPLCVKRVVPDFFLIFKVDKMQREKMVDAYSESLQNIDKLRYFLKYGKIVKAFDLRYGSKLGTYIRNIYKHSSEVTGDLYESYDAHNLNKYNGISVDRGVVTTMFESGYKEEIVSNQVALNDFYTEGFERNRLLSKDIINFEFMFNDESSEVFSLNTYFGLYVRVNEQDEDFSCIGVDTSGELSFDTKVASFNSGVNLSNTQYASMIYALTTPNSFHRLNGGVADSSIVKSYMLKPHKSLSTFHIRKLDATEINNFITLTLNSPLEVGEHIRVIDVASNTIYEIIVCDDTSSSFLEGKYVDDNKLSEVITNYFNELGSAFTIKRIGLYSYYRANYKSLAEDENVGIEEFVKNICLKQTEQLYYAFRKFNEDCDAPVSSYKKLGNQLSLVGYTKSLLFERICSPSIFDDVMQKYVKTTEDENNSMTFFGNYQAHKTLLEVNDVDSSITGIAYWKTKKYAYLYPIHFEFSGTRIAYIMPFINTKDLSNDGKIYSCDLQNPDDIFNNKTILYYSNTPAHTDVSTNIVDKIKVDYFTNSDDFSNIYITSKYLNYITSYNNLNEKIIKLSNPIISNSTLSLYLPYKLNSGVCSIFNIKDFDFDVLDNSNYINNINGAENILSNKGEYNSRSFFEHSLGAPSSYSLTPPKGENFYEMLDEWEKIKENNNKDVNGTVLRNTSIKWDLNISRPDDSLLRYKDEDDEYHIYAVVHCTLEEFNDKIKSYAKSILNSVDTSNYNHLTRAQYQSLSNLIQNDDAVYPYTDIEGYVLRPYLGGSTTYNTLYKYFNLAIPTSFKYGITYLEFVEDDESPANSYGKWPGYYSVTYPIISDLISVFPEKTYLGSTYYEDTKSYYKSYSPLMTSSEESFKNYIDKFDSFTKDTASYTLSGAISNVINNRSKYLKHLYSNNHKAFDISLICPHACKWKSNGTDARIENLRLLYKTNTAPKANTSFYIADASSFNSYLGILYLKERNTTGYSLYSTYKNSDFTKYINRALDDVVLNKENDATLGTEELDYILYDKGALDDILYDALNYKNKFSIANLSGIDTIDFISGGVKFKIKSNNLNIFNTEKYKGYSICFVNIPTHSKNGKNTEIIIDETRNEIMLIWYSNTNTNMYGVKYSFKSEREVDETDVLQGLIKTKINYTGTIDDIKPASLLIDGYYSYSTQKMYGRRALDVVKVEDTMNFSKYVDTNTKLSETIGESSIGFTRKGKQLCVSTGYIFISNIGIDNTSYTKKHPVAVASLISNSIFLPNNLLYSDYFSYYDGKGNLIGYEPYIWHDDVNGQYNYHDKLTLESFGTYVYNYPSNYETLLYTDDINCITSSIRTMDDLKYALKKCGLFIKTAYGTYDYSTKQGLFNVTIDEPIKYSHYKNYRHDLKTTGEYVKDYELSVLPTFAEPVMKNMLEFEYNSAGINDMFDENESQNEQVTVIRSLEKVFNKSFDGANVFVKDVNNINQMWYNKYTKIPNYCVINSRATGTISHMMTSVHYDTNISILADSWVNTKYKEFTYSIDGGSYPLESVNEVNGFTTGYELKTFLNSKALSLNAKEIEITNWKNVEVDPTTNSIKIDITESLIYLILTNSAFIKSWKTVKGATNEMKTKYIKNYILNFININNKTRFILKRGNIQHRSLRFDTIFKDEKTIEYKNFKNELKYENGKYYMYVYPDGKYAYYAKMIITL